MCKGALRYIMEPGMGREGALAKNQRLGQGLVLPPCHVPVQNSKEFQDIKFEPNLITCCGGVFIKVTGKIYFI